MTISVFKLKMVVVLINYGIKRTPKQENAVMQNFVHNYKFMISYNKQMAFNIVLPNVLQKSGNTIFIFLKKKYAYQAAVIMILPRHLLLILNNVFQHQKKTANHIITWNYHIKIQIANTFKMLQTAQLMKVINIIIQFMYKKILNFVHHVKVMIIRRRQLME